MSPIDKVISAVALVCLSAPALLGAFMLYSACFRRSWGKGKRYPVTLSMRLFAGGIGFLLMFLDIRELVSFSKELVTFSK